MSKPLEIDVAAAEAALEAAGINPLETKPAGLPSGWTDGPTPSKPAAAATPSVEAPEAPEAPAATPPEETEAPGFDFSSITDEAILAGEVTPEQLAAMRRGMNADFTKKSQEVAPWRKLANELGVESPEEIREAVETFQRLQDPRNWSALHGELSEYLQQHGMSPAAAAASASEQLANNVPDTPDLSMFEGMDPDDQDPSVAPLVQAIQALQNQVSTLSQSQTQAEEQRQQQAQYDAIATQLTRTEQEIRASNPNYTEDDIQLMYRLMPGDGSDPSQQLKAAAQSYESEIASRVARYIQGKGSAIEAGPTPLAGGGVIPTEPAKKLTPEEGHRAAMAHAARLDQMDAQ